MNHFYFQEKAEVTEGSRAELWGEGHDPARLDRRLPGERLGASCSRTQSCEQVLSHVTLQWLYSDEASMV